LLIAISNHDTMGNFTAVVPLGPRDTASTAGVHAHLDVCTDIDPLVDLRWRREPYSFGQGISHPAILDLIKHKVRRNRYSNKDHRHGHIEKELPQSIQCSDVRIGSCRGGGIVTSSVARETSRIIHFGLPNPPKAQLYFNVELMRQVVTEKFM
jgi:hypothetical protein